MAYEGKFLLPMLSLLRVHLIFTTMCMLVHCYDGLRVLHCEGSQWQKYY